MPLIESEYMDSVELDEIDEDETEGDVSSENKLFKLPRFPNEEQTEIDCDKIIVGNDVLHYIFGSGKITHIDKEKHLVRIKFEIGEKLFLFPDAFKMGYLKIKDNEPL